MEDSSSKESESLKLPQNLEELKKLQDEWMREGAKMVHSTFAHYVNNGLVPVLMTAELLLMEPGLSDSQVKDLEQIRDATDKLAERLKQIGKVVDRGDLRPDPKLADVSMILDLDQEIPPKV